MVSESWPFYLFPWESPVMWLLCVLNLKPGRFPTALNLHFWTIQLFLLTCISSTVISERNDIWCSTSSHGTSQWLLSIRRLSIFSFLLVAFLCCDKNTREKHFQREGLLQLTVWRYSPSQGIHNQEAGMLVLNSLSCFVDSRGPSPWDIATRSQGGSSKLTQLPLDDPT